MKLEPLTQMFLRVQPHLSREEARRKARGFRAILKQLPHRWQISLELLAAAYLDDADRYPGLTDEQALQYAEALRRELRRVKRMTRQSDFEARCLSTDFSALEVDHED